MIAAVDLNKVCICQVFENLTMPKLLDRLGFATLLTLASSRRILELTGDTTARPSCRFPGHTDIIGQELVN